MSHTLSSEDLFQFIFKDELMQQMTSGIYPIDKLPHIISTLNFCFINSDPSFLPGKHWICIFFPANSPPEFFDSLGRTPSHYSNAMISFLGQNYIYNTIRLQPQGSSTCGLFCLYFLYYRIRGYSFLDIIKTFTNNLHYNDAIVIDFYEGFE